MLRRAGPPQISESSPLHFAVHLPGTLALLLSWLPQKHWPPFSVPAYFAPMESQCATQLLDVIFAPHHSGCCPKERGFNASRKHPAAFHTPDLLLTDAGDCPEGSLVPLGAGSEGAVVTGSAGAVVVTGSEGAVVVAGLDATGAVTDVGSATFPLTAQLAGFVARPGPGWIGLQPGKAFKGFVAPISSLTLGAIVHASF